MVRALLCGSTVGSVAGMATGGLLAYLGVPLLTALGAGVAAAAAVASTWWTVAALRAAVRRVRAFTYRRRTRAWRRTELASAAARSSEDEVTRDLDPLPHPPIDAGWNRARLAEAADAVRRSDRTTAIAALTELLDRAPHHAEAKLARGRIYGDLGDFERALLDLADAEVLAPYSAEPLIAAGEVHFARKDYVRAVHAFDVALRLDPDNPDAYVARGLAHHHRSCFALAIDDFQAALRIDRDTPYAAAHLANATKRLRAESPEPAKATARRRR